MDPVTFCKRCKMTVHTECTKEDFTTCWMFKAAEARKKNNEAGAKLALRAGIAKIEAAKIHTGDGAEVGRKNDDGKVPLDLLAPEFLTGTAMVLQFGANKYNAYNWAKGMKWSRVFAALMRHMWKWWAGEKIDPETGLSHLWHAACSLMFLIAYEQRGTGDDDRPV